MASILAFLVLVFCNLLLSAQAFADEPGTSKTMLVVGDSISAGYGIQREQGWVQILQQHLETEEAPWRVVNASVSGETTGGGLARLPTLLKSHSPELVLIELGGNDGLRGYPIKKIRQNLEAMVAQVIAIEATPVIMAMRIPPNYGPRYTQKFDGVFAEVATASSAELIPFFLSEIALQPGMMQQDGIHPTAAAQPTMASTVAQALNHLLLP